MIHARPLVVELRPCFHVLVKWARFGSGGWGVVRGAPVPYVLGELRGRSYATLAPALKGHSWQLTDDPSVKDGSRVDGSGGWVRVLARVPRPAGIVDECPHWDYESPICTEPDCAGFGR